MNPKKPTHYEHLRALFPQVIEQLEAMGKSLHEAGPLSETTVLLTQMCAAAAMHSEGSVRSHARRALAAGATAEQVRHALIAQLNTIGFPTVAAALAWIEEDL